MLGLTSLAWDEVRRHPLRTLLTLLSVAIGVGAVVAVHCASSAARKSFAGLHESLTGKVDWEVVAVDGSRFAVASVATLGEVDGVAQAVRVLRRATILYTSGKRITTTALGVDDADLRTLSQYTLVAGRLWHSPAPREQAGTPSAGDASAGRLEVLLETELARNLGVAVGDTATCLLPRGPTRTVVVGLVSQRSAAAVTENESVLFRLSDLQRATRSEGQIDQLRIQMAADYARVKVQQQLQARLPPGLTIRTPVTRTDLADATLRAADQGLNFAQAIALLMALFIICNTFLISVTQRYRQWGLLRAVGATRGQVLRLVIVEALAIGVAGSLLWLAAGVVSARSLADAIAGTMDTQVQRVELPISLSVSVLVLGPLLAVLGCCVPARKACLALPIEAVRGDLPRIATPVPRLLVIAACLLWCCSSVVIALCVAELLTAQLAIVAGLGMLLGFVLMVPPVLPGTAQVLSRALLSHIWPAESQLAQDQVFQSRLRTSLTTAVVVVALANTIGLGHALLNSVDDVRDWYRRSMSADLILLPSQPDLAAEYRWQGANSPVLQIQRVAEVRDVQTVRLVNVRANDQPALLIARSFRGDDESPLRLSDAVWPTVQPELEQGSVVVGGMLARLCRLGVGGVLRVEYAGRTAEFSIAAIVTDYHYGGLSVYVEREVAVRQLGIDGVSAFLVTLDPRGSPASREAVIACAQHLQLTVYSFEELRSWLDGLMDGVVAAFWVVLGLGLVVASFGIFNTITVNVLEQTREIGLLRVVGMTRGQVLRTVLAQGVILAFLGTLFGTAAGLTTAFLMHLCKGPLLGAYSAFHWRPGLIVLANLASFVLVLAASYRPARKAAHSNTLESIQEE
jgi:putative ABC transport system permease protein